VIPTKQGGLGAILNNAPLLLERLSTLTDRLNQLLSDPNQKSIQGILANSERVSGDLADATPQLRTTMAELQGTLRQATATLRSFDGVAHRADALLGQEGGSLAAQLRDTLGSVKGAAEALRGTIGDARPALKQASQTTLPAAEAAIRDLQATSRALRSVTEKIDAEGAGALVRSRSLPDYKP
jgi:phospholipid/cholesterol/gamma-HCH transport system substrate-binding protein